MAKIEYENVDDWLNLSDLIDDNFTHFNNYIFRGQADSNWLVESTLTRTLNKLDTHTLNKEKLAEHHLDNFIENIRGRFTSKIKDMKKNEIWALGQHFGLHTPLLDFTRSPYIALFFSLLGECKSGKRVIWAVLESDIKVLNKKSKNKIKVVNPLTHENRRLVSQRGLFLKMPIGSNLEQWVQESDDQEWITMYKITFPDSLRKEALSALNNMNINHLSLFPDLFGSSFYANYQLETEPYLEQERDKVWEKASQSEL